MFNFKYHWTSLQVLIKCKIISKTIVSDIKCFQYQILCTNRKGICIRGRVHYLHIHCPIFFYYICSHFFQIMHHGILAFPFPSYRFLNTQHPSLFFQYWTIQTDRHTGIFFYLKLLLPIYCIVNIYCIGGGGLKVKCWKL